MEEEKFRRSIRSFIVRSGRITNLQKNALDNYMPLHGIEYRNEIIDFHEIFGNAYPVIMEIGFGDGTTTWQIAQRNPDINYIAVDVYPPGVGALLDLIHNKGLTNLKVMSHDAVEVLENMIPCGSLRGFHIFFPDPWHKKRHNKRRLINPEFVKTMADRLVSGGYIYAVTDWEDYAVQMQQVLRGESALESPFESYATEDSDLVPWRAQTKFERKGLDKDRIIRESFFIKK